MLYIHTARSGVPRIHTFLSISLVTIMTVEVENGGHVARNEHAGSDLSISEVSLALKQKLLLALGTEGYVLTLDTFH